MKPPLKKMCVPLPGFVGKCRRVVLKMNPADIAYVVLIFEAYDYIGVPRTIDKVNGVIEALVAPDFLDDARRIVRALDAEVESLEVLLM